MNTGVKIYGGSEQKRLEGACKRARSTGELNICNMELMELPPYIYNINEEDFGGNWFEMVGITKILARDNKLCELSSAIEKWMELETLELSNNMLLALPQELESLTALRALKVSGNRLQELPDAFTALTALALLNANNNDLLALPPSLIRCRALAALDLSDNRLARLPPSAGAYWGNLVRLNLSHNVLDLCEMEAMPALQELDISHNKLSALPEFVRACPKLKILVASYNRITSIDSVCGNTNLAELHVGYNRIASLPEDVASCTSLSVLAIHDNLLESIPATLADLPALSTLAIQNNSLRTLPPDLGRLQGTLVRLSAEGNQFADLKHATLQKGTVAVLDLLRTRMATEAAPADLPEQHMETLGASGRLVVKAGGGDVFPTASMRGRDYDAVTAIIAADAGLARVDGALLVELFPALVTMDFSSNSLTEMPINMDQLRDLKNASFRKNRITAVADSVAFCRCLETLDLSINKISSYAIPENVFARLPLRELNMSYNCLKAFPFGPRGVPPRLETLIVSNNQITAFPEDMADAFVRVGLGGLDIANNSITSIPPVLGRCPLRSLQIEGNLLRRIRTSVISQGTEAILMYLRRQL